ncbi:MAG: hypothetical protein QNI99_03035 [Woeseiaceae bacterium]|nr:hypothetical protein [Woeseiaceae bacterium]
MIAFQIGGEDADFVRITITGDNQDGWLLADVEVSAGRFRVRYDASFDTRAFSEFARQLKTLHQTVSGSASFTSLERQLELTLTCSSLGRISVRGEAMDEAGTGNKLLFKLGIEFDQTHLPEILESLNAMLKKHPERPFC